MIALKSVGPVAYGRMLRDRVVVPLGSDAAMPRDLPITATARAAAAAPAVPRHTVLSGLAGLWVHVGGTRPATAHLVGVRGLHRAPPGSTPAGWHLRFHSGRAAHEPALLFGDVRVATVPRCVVDALRWDDLGDAIRAIAEIARAGRFDVSAIDKLVRSENPRVASSARVRSAWAALRGPLTSRASPPSPG